MKKLVFKSILFSIFIAIVIYSLDRFFVDDDPIFTKYSFFYKKPSNSLDVVFLGNSHLANGINTRIVNAKCNVNSFNLGMRGTSLFQTYYNLKEVLTYQKPKLVVIENFTFLESNASKSFLNKDGEMDVKNFKAIYAKKIGAVKLEELDYTSENKLYNSLNVFRSHENWSDLEQQSKVLYQNFSKKYEKSFFIDHYRSLTFLDPKRAASFDKEKFETKIDISEDQQEYIEKIIALSIEEDFDLIFLTVPFYNKYYKQIKGEILKANSQLNTMFSKYDNVTLLDLNEMGDFSRTYFLNERTKRNQHLNYKGGIKATNLLANFINANYEFKDSKRLLKSVSYPEDILYTDRITETDTTFQGDLLVNETRGKNIVIPKNQQVFDIKGWMYKEGTNNLENKKVIAFKKNDDFIYITAFIQVNKRTVSNLVKSKDESYRNSGYVLKLNKAFLETGKHEIYQIIMTENGDWFSQKTNKFVTIE